MSNFVEKEIIKRTERSMDAVNELALTREATRNLLDKVKSELNTLKGRMWAEGSNYYIDIEKIVKMLED